MSKIAIHISLGLNEGHPYRRSLLSSKENIQALRKNFFVVFFVLLQPTKADKDQQRSTTLILCIRYR
jgi:hypothetical protein